MLTRILAADGAELGKVGDGLTRGRRIVVFNTVPRRVIRRVES
jgi:hypothetical protein